MSFLDNLENNLNALERIEEKDPEKVKREQERRESERNAALLRAPYVDAIKNSAFTSNLLTECRVLGRNTRVLVRFTWIGETLRLDTPTKRLELVPMADGVYSVFSGNGVELERSRIDLDEDNPASLASRWLS